MRTLLMILVSGSLCAQITTKTIAPASVWENTHGDKRSELYDAGKQFKLLNLTDDIWCEVEGGYVLACNFDLTGSQLESLPMINCKYREGYYDDFKWYTEEDLRRLKQYPKKIRTSPQQSHLGMSKGAAQELFGTPNDVNETVGSWGTREQWVYGAGVYLYFKNGVLSSYQK